MTKMLIPFALMLAILACNTKGNEKPTQATVPIGAENVKIVQAMIDAFNQHDWAKMASFYTEPASFLDPANGISPVPKTHKETIQHYTELQAWSPDVKDSITLIAPVGSDKVVMQFISSGHMAEGNEAWSLPICSILTIKDGKIVLDETYYDKE